MQSNNPNSAVYYNNGSNYQRNTRPDIPSYRTPDPQPPVRLDPLPPRTQQPVATPTLMPASPTPATAHITPAPLNYWPDQPGGQSGAQPVRNIMDSDI
ncbi:hypothetical protein OESDEN_15097 [Oesophagostomum dentatum]|uniref:Uncharacterized protein n=1 Tax=Oesophagostomum dentatum TaxID=61180 RepID=A0A0B1SMU2_OESDE|nr:hypothetical protein OESDEN_15097 [Oesophagostomum dentatum]